MNIIILGAPGAGKGTQGEILAGKLKLPRLSVGAVLRRVWKESGPEGEKIGQYILKGLNVPADILFEVLEPWFAGHPEGFVVDNLPRNLDQLEEFKKFLEKTGTKIDKVFHLIIAEEESIKRLSFRQRKRMKESYGRPDEDPAIIKTRIHEGYQKEIEPILDYFRQMGVLVEIDGEQDIQKVSQEIFKNLNL